jgi:hypothetical protein
VQHVRLYGITAGPPALDECIGFIELQVRLMVESMQGSVGMTLLVSRPSGTAVLESFWATHETLLASREPTAPIRDEMARRAGEPVTEREYHVPVFEREGQLLAGQAARLSRMEVKPSSMTDVIEVFADTAVPQQAELPGFRGALLFTDRDQGHLVSESVWADPRARAAGPVGAEMIQPDLLNAAGYVVRGVEDYDVAFSTARNI